MPLASCLLPLAFESMFTTQIQKLYLIKDTQLETMSDLIDLISLPLWQYS
ncbi:MAG: hypothetical protein F6J90_08055 [Moorea sp. SIOASIH]|nr:hypothetical protein [Moorena sp. SIOASIH]NEO36274.1 hypothetical protein [Moorena sp. SIOASIH]